MKKLISFMVCFAVITGIFGITATAHSESFKMGDSITASYSADGTVLTVTGSGSMWEFTEETAPTNQKTKKIIIEEGIKDISDYAFCSFPFVEIIELPESLVKIGNCAFQYCDIKSIQLPKTLQSIGKYAFAGCDLLEELIIPENVTYLGEGAFAFCDSLTSVTVNNKNIKNLASAFHLASKLEAFVVPENNDIYTQIDGVLYTKSGKTLVRYPVGKKATSFSIPSGVKVIGDHAFENTRLEKVTFNNNLETIKESAFLASSIESIILPKGITYIGPYAFSECFEVEKLTLPANIKKINKGSFKSIDIDTLKIPVKVTYIDKEAFADSGIKTLILSKSIKTIKAGAFKNCQDLEIVKVGSCTASGLGEAFIECSEIEKFTVSKTNKAYSVKNGVLFNKAKTRLVKYPADKSGKSYTVPSTVKLIDSYAFSYSTKLRSVVLPKKLKKVNKYAFAYSAIKTASLPSKLTYIGVSAFTGTNITEVTLPKSLKTIGKNAFRDCYSLKTVNIANCETKSNLSLAFNYNDSIKNFKVAKSNRKYSVKDGVLFNKSYTKLIKYPAGKKATKYTVPTKVTVIGTNAFNSAYKLRKISLPKKLKTIGDEVFRGTSITSFTIPKTVTKIGSYAFVPNEEAGDIKITLLCKKAPTISHCSFVNASGDTYGDCIIYVTSKSVKTALQKQFSAKGIESKIIVK